MMSVGTRVVVFGWQRVCGLRQLFVSIAGSWKLEAGSKKASATPSFSPSLPNFRLPASGFQLSRLRRESGFTLIGVIFLIVVLAGLLVFMITMANTSAYTATQAYRQTQTYAAARAGIDWGAYQAFNGGGCNGAFNLPAAPDYNVMVSCGAPTTHTEQGQTIDVYTITSTATTGVYGQPYYVRRTITASVSIAPP